MKLAKSLVAALAVAALCSVIVPAGTGSASGGSGGGGGGGVAGKCGTITSISAANVTLTSSGGVLSLRGSVTNCSIYLQSYWISFDEPSRATPATSGCLNCGGVTSTTPCQASFTLSLNALLYMSSGSSRSWSASTNIAPAGVADPATCVGTHTLRAQLKNRTDGSVMSTVYVNYLVS